MKNQILLDAVNQYGSPLYVYDSNKIKSQFNRLTESFKNVKKLQINYAVKASSNISIDLKKSVCRWPVILGEISETIKSNGSELST